MCTQVCSHVGDGNESPEDTDAVIILMMMIVMVMMMMMMMIC
jgi:ABC-type Na+ efflux pump permease subunit